MLCGDYKRTPCKPSSCVTKNCRVSVAVPLPDTTKSSAPLFTSLSTAVTLFCSRPSFVRKYLCAVLMVTSPSNIDCVSEGPNVQSVRKPCECAEKVRHLERVVGLGFDQPGFCESKTSVHQNIASRLAQLWGPIRSISTYDDFYAIYVCDIMGQCCFVQPIQPVQSNFYG